MRELIFALLFTSLGAAIGVWAFALVGSISDARRPHPPHVRRMPAAKPNPSLRLDGILK